MPEHETSSARRQLLRDDRGKIVDVRDGKAVAIETLGTSVLDGKRFTVTDGNGRDVTISVLRDVAIAVVATVPRANRQTDVGPLSDMLRSITGATAHSDFFRRVRESTE